MRHYGNLAMPNLLSLNPLKPVLAGPGIVYLGTAQCEMIKCSQLSVKISATISASSKNR